MALQRQRERSIPAQPVLPATPQMPPMPGFGSARFDASTYAASQAVIPSSQPSRPEELVINQDTLNEQRKRNNREKLQRLLQNITLGLRDVDLESQDITEVEKRAINDVVRRLGQIAYNHPDTPRVMTEHYPRALEDIKGLRDTQISNDREETDRDTRTGR